MTNPETKSARIAVDVHRRNGTLISAVQVIACHVSLDPWFDEELFERAVIDYIYELQTQTESK